jgi:hypothetical protein
MPFDALPEGTRAKLRHLAEIASEELPAIAYYFDDSIWALVTDKRLIWSFQAIRTEVPLSSIDDATVELEALAPGGTKKDLRDLTILTKNGERYKVQLETGSPFSGFWNALKMAARWNK